jgi:membrane fusion protein
MSERALFRREAVAFQRQHRQWGQVSVLQPVPTGLTTWFLTAAVVLIVCFLYCQGYARKETVTGYLKPASGTAKIFASQRGTIREIHVKDGQQVEQGQPLLTVQTNQVAADDRDVNATMLDTLRSQQASLSRQIDAEARRVKSEQDRLSATGEQLERQIAELNQQIEIQTARIKLSNDFVSAAETLKVRGDIADIELKRRQMALLEQQQSLSSLRQQVAERNSELTQSQASLQQLPTVMAQTVLGLRNQLADTEQRIAEVDARRAYVIRSPTAGQVATLQATVGQAVDPQQLQLEIVPADRNLVAELYVPTRAIGFVREGQSVRILYDAFPYQNFGTYGGRIISISQTILTAPEVGGPVALHEPAYKVTAKLDRPDIEAYGRQIALQPDMLLKADIILERRSLLRWFFGPLLSIRG